MTAEAGKPKRYFKEPHSGKVVGYHDGAVYFTKRNPDPEAHHYFVKFQGYGVSFHILESCRFDGIILVCIVEHKKDGRDRNLFSKLPDWFRKSFRYDWRGDEQRVLPLKYMREESQFGLEPFTSYTWNE